MAAPSLGSQLRTLRQRLGLSQAQVAAFLREGGDPLPVERLQHWEHDRRRPRSRRALLIIAAELHKLNPTAVPLAAVEQLIQTYQPPLPLTAAERTEFFPTAPLPAPPVRLATGDGATLPPGRATLDSAGVPFVAGPPITEPRQFFGRSRVLLRLFNLLQRPPLQNAAIIGPRQYGKTSLLHYLARITTTPADQLRPDQRADWLPHPERYRWIYVDFRDPQLRTPEGILRYLLVQLGSEVPQPCTMPSFTALARQHLHSPTVVLLDDIDVALQHYPELDYFFWEGLRALALNQVGGNLGFVLTANAPFAQLAQHHVAGSPFFTIFGYSTTLNALTETEARELIASAPQPFPPPDVDWILAQSERRPMPLQILCRERLLALELGETDNDWQAESLRQLALFRTAL